MNITEAIQSRRSIRNFRNTRVPGRPSAQAGRCRQARAQCQQSTGMEIFLCHRTGPRRKSGHVQSRTQRPSARHPGNLFRHGICPGHSRYVEIYGCMMDASMAAENIMLAALEEGLGTCAIKSYTDAAVAAQTPLSPRYIPHRNANVHRLP